MKPENVLFEFSAAQPDSSDDFSERRPQCQTFIARFRWLLLRTKCGVHARYTSFDKFLKVSAHGAARPSKKYVYYQTGPHEEVQMKV